MTREAKMERTAEKYAEGNPNAILIYRAFKDGAEWADKHPAKKQAVTIEAWVARNGNGTIHLWDDCPFRRPFKSQKWWESLYGASVELSENAFPSVTFGNSPKKVKVTIELEDKEPTEVELVIKK